MGPFYSAVILVVRIGARVAYEGGCDKSRDIV